MPPPPTVPIPTSSTSAAIARAHALAKGESAPTLSGGFYPLPNPQMTHPENTTVFVGGLPGSVGREELIAVFEPFGEVTYVNIPTSKGCGFVAFDNRASAEWAIEQLQGFWLHGSQLRLAWGRIQGSSTKPKPQTKSNAADLSAQINLDLPFFSQMLDLTAEQQVKLNLYLEFAVAGNIGRLKDIMSISGGSSVEMKTAAPQEISTSAPAKTSKHPYRSDARSGWSAQHENDPYGYQVDIELCKQYDRLVSDTPEARSRTARGSSSTSISSSPPPLSFAWDSDRSTTSPAYSTSPLPTPASGSITAFASASSEAMFRAFQPTPTSGDKGLHRHSETCVTPLSLRKLDKHHQHARSANSCGYPGIDGLGLSHGIGALGLNASAGEWIPRDMGAGPGSAGELSRYQGKW